MDSKKLPQPLALLGVHSVSQSSLSRSVPDWGHEEDVVKEGWLRVKQGTNPLSTSVFRYLSLHPSAIHVSRTYRGRVYKRYPLSKGCEVWADKGNRSICIAFSKSSRLQILADSFELSMWQAAITGAIEGCLTATLGDTDLPLGDELSLTPTSTRSEPAKDRSDLIFSSRESAAASDNSYETDVDETVVYETVDDETVVLEVRTRPDSNRSSASALHSSNRAAWLRRASPTTWAVVSDTGRPTLSEMGERG